MNIPVGLQELEAKFDMYREALAFLNMGNIPHPPRIVEWAARNVQYVSHPEADLDHATKRTVNQFLFGGTGHTTGLSFDLAYTGETTFQMGEEHMQFTM
jgi:hypothetical protein